MSSTYSLSKSAEALSAIVLNPRVSKEAKHSTLNRMDGIRPRSVGEPSAGASSSRARSRSRGSADPVQRKLRNPLHRLVAMFVGEKIPEVPRIRERGLAPHHGREDPRSVQSRSREVHTSQKPRQVPVPGQVQERHPHHSHSHREHHAHETRARARPHRDHRPRHEDGDQPRPHRHEREHEHRHSLRHRENHVHFVDEERPARIVAQQKALVLGERGVRLTD